jgi:hypothetical protein
MGEVVRVGISANLTAKRVDFRLGAAFVEITGADFIDRVKNTRLWRVFESDRYVIYHEINNLRAWQVLWNS